MVVSVSRPLAPPFRRCSTAEPASRSARTFRRSQGTVGATMAVPETACCTVKLVREGSLSAGAAVRECLRRAERADRELHAFECFDCSAQAQAAKVDTALAMYDERQGNGGPDTEYVLPGVLVGVKSAFATTTDPTTFGTTIHAQLRLPFDADIVQYLRAEGVVTAGKTTLTEYCSGAQPATVNPLGADRTPGGSSSGSAVAVAAGMVPIALGSQTMGSVIRPASYCGVFGFKPSFGVVARGGLMRVVEQLDTVGWFARTIEDIHLIFRAVTACGAKGSGSQVHGASVAAEGHEQFFKQVYPPGDLGVWNGASTAGADMEDANSLPGTPREPDGPGRYQAKLPCRAVLVETAGWAHASQAALDTLFDAEAALCRLGVHVERVRMPKHLDDYFEHTQTLTAHGLSSAHGHDFNSHSEQMSPALQRLFRHGARVTPDQHAAALSAQAACTEWACGLFAAGAYDLALSLSVDGAPPPRADGTGSPRHAALWTLCGSPALHVPWRRTAEGWSLGVQLSAPHGADDRLLSQTSYILECLGMTSAPHVQAKL